MPRTIARARGLGRGQFFEAETEDKILASRPACPRGLTSRGVSACITLIMLVTYVAERQPLFLKCNSMLLSK